MNMAEKIKSSEITDEQTYLNRRNFMRLGLLGGTTAATSLAYRYFNKPTLPEVERANLETVVKASETGLSAADKPNTYKEITNYNNYYEFSTDKESAAEYAKDFITRPWTVEVGGLVQKPTTFGIEDLLKLEQQERIYRHRCVEGWSMVIPWVGFTLKTLLDKVEPLGNAKFVAFETYFDKKQMPNWRYAGIDLPYVEGLRLDEAKHNLTILATGIYGKQLPNQNGSPIRLVVPWKYGFKSIKSIVKITLTDKQPPTTWNLAASREYGFYSNVNPEVRHPRWSQATEQRIGEFSRRETLMFNGYADEVAKLYDGMDLKKNF
jgi:methionine sulfoxide reductase catalytic subunit